MSENKKDITAPVTRRRFMAGLGGSTLGLSAVVLLAGRAQASAPHKPSVPQDPALSALTAASIGGKLPASLVAPSVNLGASGGTSAIANSVSVLAVTNPVAGSLNPLFRYLSMAPGPAGTAAPDSSLVRSVNVATGPLPITVAEFLVDGSQFELIEKGQGGVYRLTVDGRLMSPSAVPAAPADNTIYYRLIDFGGVRAERTIRVEYSGAGFGGVQIGPNDALYSPSRPLGPRAVVLGDEWTAGYGADGGFVGFASFLGALMGWDCWPSGLGGTGYLAPGASGVTLRQRAQSDVIAYNPEVVVVAGGVYDQAYAPADLASEAAALYSALQSALPTARIVVVGPWSAGTPASSSVLSVRDTLSAQAASAGLQFVDPTGWVTGTGNAGSAPVSGNASYYTSADGVHPTQAGHEYLGHRLASELMRQNTL